MRSNGRLIIADDQTILVEGVRMMLEPEFDIAGTVGDGRTLLHLAADVKPDVILLDIALPLLNGIDAARELKHVSPASRAIFLSRHAEPAYVAEAFRAGGVGYVPKWSERNELVSAIRQVLSGRQYVSPRLTDDRPKPLVPRMMPDHSAAGKLTPRQRQILVLVAEGCSRKEIAARLNISVRTVEFHKAALANGFSLRSTADFTRYAFERGLISIGTDAAELRAVATEPLSSRAERRAIATDRKLNRAVNV